MTFWHAEIVDGKGRLVLLDNHQKHVGAAIDTPPDELKTLLIDRIAVCEQCIECGQVPEKSPDLPKSVCEYCNYKSLCRMEE